MIYVFRTSVETAWQADRVSEWLQYIPHIRAASFDLEDCDRVLRVECENLEAAQIIRSIHACGFRCEELD